MSKWIVCAILGNIVVLFLPVLPSLSLLFGLSLSILLIIPRRSYCYLASFLCGFVWTVCYSHYQLEQRLPEQWQGKPLQIVGLIASIPDINQHRARFMMQTEQLCYQQHCYPWKRAILLSWYGEHPPLAVEQRWQMDVRLKRGRGLQNSVGLDYTAYLLQAHIAATGYVTIHGEQQLLETKDTKSLLKLRENIHHIIAFHISNQTIRGIVNALTIGEKADITQTEWRILQATGTNHLLAISGLHIGMIASLYFFVGKFLWRYCGNVMLYISARQVGVILGMIAATIYSGLAGFAISTQRALIMSGFAMVATLSSRKTSLNQMLLYAWLVILIYNPLAPLSRGFCLSFLAVFILTYGFSCRVGRSGPFLNWFKTQWVIGIGMLPIVLLYFQQFSFISFLANIIAVPFVGFVIVPLILLTCVCQWISSATAAWLWYIVEKLVQFLWILLTKMASVPQLLWHPFFAEKWEIVLAVIAIVILLSPRGLPGRYLAWFGLIPLCLPNASVLAGQAKVTVLDVGQGLAVVVQTKQHTLLYDTGPRSDEHDSGNSVIIPYLYQQGINKINKLVISHMDLDHRGGVESIMQTMSVENFITSEPSFYNQYHPQECYRGQQWQWDGVTFTVLFPPQQWQGSRNDRSCVVRVDAGNDSLLLTGDIERNTEKFLLENNAQLSARVLLVPHHGSKTSSLPDFIAKVDPDVGLIANGYRNRYRLPHQAVVKRYQQQKVKLFETAEEGAIEFVLGNVRQRDIKTYRQQHPHFWQ